MRSSSPSRASVLAWGRLGIGVGCVAAAVVLAAVHVPRAVHTMNAEVRSYAYITSAEQRVTTSGDMLGLTAELQDEALLLIPPYAHYLVAYPANPLVAQERYGIGSITYEVLVPWLRYLLIPAGPVSTLAQAQYVICWGCDRRELNGQTSWLWQGSSGQAIGRVRS